ncbi:hypothetical protein SBDP1_880014 [Syntrophobacter sp. SbD1]|nr:hypothetical protein SBDP1_880014 [Syntrophobacter sp. SbD1]
MIPRETLPVCPCDAFLSLCTRERDVEDYPDFRKGGKSVWKKGFSALLPLGVCGISDCGFIRVMKKGSWVGERPGNC